MVTVVTPRLPKTLPAAAPSIYLVVDLGMLNGDGSSDW